MNKKDIINIIILHGWNLSGDKYSVAKSILESFGYKVFTPDLPGFGKEVLNQDNLTLNDYSEFVIKFIKEKKLDNIVLVGHSFGGRVIVKYLNNDKDYNKIVGIVLTGSPLIKEVISFRKLLLYKLLKPLKATYIFFSKRPKDTLLDTLRKIAYKLIGEMDYYRASKNNMKNTFLNIIQENQEDLLKNISIPTLILWGRNDNTTPVKIGNKIHSLIKNSKLKIIDDSNHKLPYNMPDIFAKEIHKFINTL